MYLKFEDWTNKIFSSFSLNCVSLWQLLKAIMSDFFFSHSHNKNCTEIKIYQGHWQKFILGPILYNYLTTVCCHSMCWLHIAAYLWFCCTFTTFLFMSSADSACMKPDIVSFILSLNPNTKKHLVEFDTKEGFLKPYEAICGLQWHNSPFYFFLLLWVSC